MYRARGKEYARDSECNPSEAVHGSKSIHERRYLIRTCSAGISRIESGTLQIQLDIRAEKTRKEVNEMSSTCIAARELTVERRNSNTCARLTHEVMSCFPGGKRSADRGTIFGIVHKLQPIDGS